MWWWWLLWSFWDLAPASAADYQMLHHFWFPFRQLWRQVAMLTLHRCKYSTHTIPVRPSGHRSTVTLRFNLYTSSPIWSPKQPTSPNAILCPLFHSHSWMFPSHCGWLTIPFLTPSASLPSTSQAEHAFRQPPQTWFAATEVLWCVRPTPRGCICTTRPWFSI